MAVEQNTSRSRRQLALRELGALARLERDELIRRGRAVELAAGAVDIHGEDGAPIPPVAEADEAAVGEDGREAAQLDGVLDDDQPILVGADQRSSG